MGDHLAGQDETSKDKRGKAAQRLFNGWVKEKTSTSGTGEVEEDEDPLLSPNDHLTPDELMIARTVFFIRRYWTVQQRAKRAKKKLADVQITELNEREQIGRDLLRKQQLEEIIGQGAAVDGPGAEDAAAPPVAPRIPKPGSAKAGSGKKKSPPKADGKKNTTPLRMAEQYAQVEQKKAEFQRARLEANLKESEAKRVAREQAHLDKLHHEREVLDFQKKAVANNNNAQNTKVALKSLERTKEGNPALEALYLQTLQKLLNGQQE